MHETLEATFRIVTPMFIGGADQSPSDGIRPPSVKGALRFWWRALNWGRLKSGADDASALQALHDEEVRLFGGSAEQGGQGRFLLRTTHKLKTQIVTDWPRNNTGAGYMAFGILESGSVAKGNYQPHRTGLGEGDDFNLCLDFQSSTDPSDIKQIRHALEAWSLFGGLGSRVRRGMGSVTLMTMDGMEQLLTQDEYEKRAAEFLGEFSVVAIPPYTAFSSDAHFRLLESGNKARQVLDHAGQAYKKFRGQESSLRGAVKVPFGLPLQGVDTENRRASPLFFHVHALKDSQFVASVLYLPAQPFHPKYLKTTLEVVNAFAQGVAK